MFKSSNLDIDNKESQNVTFGGSFLEKISSYKAIINFSESSEISTSGKRYILSTIPHTLKTRNNIMYSRNE